MNQFKRSSKPFGAIAAMVVLATAATADHVRYRVRDLGAMDAVSSQATGINDRGVVTGNLRYSDGKVQAFVWDPKTGMRRLDPTAVQSAAFSINRRGQVVGSVQTEDGLVDAVRWGADGTRTLLAWAPFGAAATSINERGEAVGFRNEGLTFVVQEAFAWPASDPFSTWRDLFDHSSESFATDINNRGDVVGYWDGRAFLLERDGSLRILTPAGGAPAFAEAINDRRDTLISWAGSGFLLTGRKVHEIALPAGASMVFPLDLNGRRDVVGETDEEAFVWDPGSGTSNLSDLATATGASWKLLAATAINQRGEIVGYGIHNGLRRAFLLTPVFSRKEDGAP